MLEEATKQLGGIEERIKSSPTFHFLLGRIHHRRGDLAKAVEAFGACLRQLDIGSMEYLCRVCRERYADWCDSCSRCGSWNSVDLNFEEERISAEELGVREVPVWVRRRTRVSSRWRRSRPPLAPWARWTRNEPEK